MVAGKINRRQAEEIKYQLLSLQIALSKQVTESSKKFLTDIRFGRPSAGNNHPADTDYAPPAATYKAKRTIEQLRQIDEALKRLDSNEFGLCDDCGNPITFGRLKAMPMTVRCVSCERSQEIINADNGNGRHPRRVATNAPNRHNHRANYARSAAM